MTCVDTGPYCGTTLIIDEPVQLGQGQRATIGPRGESAQDFAGIRLLVKPVVGKQDVGMRMS